MDWLRQLRCEETPIAMLDFKEPGKVVCLMLHKTDKWTIYWLRAIAAIAFVLELRFLMSVQLVFIHWQKQALNQVSDISLSDGVYFASCDTAGGEFKSSHIYRQKLVSGIDIAKHKQFAMYQFQTVTLSRFLVRILKNFLYNNLLGSRLSLTIHIISCRSICSIVCFIIVSEITTNLLFTLIIICCSSVFLLLRLRRRGNKS